ncbi:MAG: hypothetical protein IPH60_16525 [Flavobacteriales bacterium]|nr:hypothetical protein [Flavobacteriales bacterium]
MRWLVIAGVYHSRSLRHIRSGSVALRELEMMACWMRRGDPPEAAACGVHAHALAL